LVNANPDPASITLVLRDSAGIELARRDLSLGANQHTAVYAFQLFEGLTEGLQGSLSFDSTQPLGAITLQEKRNSRGELLYSTLPVTDLSASPATETAIFPHIAAGEGYTTELMLMNPTGAGMTGEIQFFGAGGQPVQLESGGQAVARLAYAVPPHGTFRAALTSPSLVTGWAAAIPSNGSSAPAGSAIFAWKVNKRADGHRSRSGGDNGHSGLANFRRSRANANRVRDRKSFRRSSRPDIDLAGPQREPG
jgi:hypothetical protein